LREKYAVILEERVGGRERGVGMARDLLYNLIGEKLGKNHLMEDSTCENKKKKRIK